MGDRAGESVFYPDGVCGAAPMPERRAPRKIEPCTDAREE